MFTIVSVSWYKMPQAYHCHSALLSTFYFLSFLYFPFFYSFSKFQFYITVLSIVSMLCIRSQTLFIFSLKVCMLLPNFLYSPTTLGSGNHFSIYCFYSFAFSRTSWNHSHTVCSLTDWLLSFSNVFKIHLYFCVA